MHTGPIEISLFGKVEIRANGRTLVLKGKLAELLAIISIGRRTRIEIAALTWPEDHYSLPSALLGKFRVTYLRLLKEIDKVAPNSSVISEDSTSNVVRLNPDHVRLDIDRFEDAYRRWWLHAPLPDEPNVLELYGGRFGGRTFEKGHLNSNPTLLAKAGELEVRFVMMFLAKLRERGALGLDILTQSAWDRALALAPSSEELKAAYKEHFKETKTPKARQRAEFARIHGVPLVEERILGKSREDWLESITGLDKSRQKKVEDLTEGFLSDCYEGTVDATRITDFVANVQQLDCHPDAFRKLAEIEPDQDLALRQVVDLTVAKLHYALGQYRAALSYAVKADVGANTELQGAAVGSRLFSLMLMGQFERALQVAQGFRKRAFKEGIHRELSEVYVAYSSGFRDPSESQRLFKKLIASAATPHNKQSLIIALADVEAAANKPQLALDRLRDSVDPKDLEAVPLRYGIYRRTRGRANYILGNYDEALEDFRVAAAACRLNNDLPFVASALYWQAETFLRMGEMVPHNLETADELCHEATRLPLFRDPWDDRILPSISRKVEWLVP